MLRISKVITKIQYIHVTTYPFWVALLEIRQFKKLIKRKFYRFFITKKIRPTSQKINNTGPM